MCIEYMALLLRQNCLYRRLTIEKHCFKVSLFDDTAIYLNGNPSQFKHVFDILRTFGDQTGHKVNINKSNAFYGGSSRENGVKPFSAAGLQWLTNTIKYLGVNIPINHFDNNSIISEIFLPIINGIISVLNIWSSR